MFLRVTVKNLLITIRTIIIKSHSYKLILKALIKNYFHKDSFFLRRFDLKNCCF